jgi:molybdenum cofactor biosynthesis protein B
MPGIDEDLTFYPLRMAVLTITDTRDEQSDRSGALLVERLTSAGHELAAKRIVADDVDLVITTGGSGFSPRDVTPEAIKPLFNREMDGFSVVFHQASLETVGVATLQSRAFAGQAGDTFIFCLPGSTGAAVMDGTGCWHSNSTAVTGPVRWLARSRA